MAERVQFRRGRPLPDNTVYIGRGAHGFGRFGNPFAVGKPHPFLPHLGPITDRVHAVACYTNWLPTQPELCERVVRELRGRDLACWCPLDGGPCHGDVLLALANMTIWALTEQQPWGWAIAYAGKRVENRTWAPPRAAIGKTIAVHGGRRWAAGWQDSALLRQAWSRFETDAARHGVPIGPLGPGAPYCDEGIVALVTLTGAHIAADGCCPPWGQPGFRHPLRGWVDVHHWVLDDLTVLNPPLPCRGHQGLWTPPPATRAALIGATG